MSEADRAAIGPLLRQTGPLSPPTISCPHVPWPVCLIPCMTSSISKRLFPPLTPPSRPRLAKPPPRRVSPSTPPQSTMIELRHSSVHYVRVRPRPPQALVSPFVTRRTQGTEEPSPSSAIERSPLPGLISHGAAPPSPPRGPYCQPASPRHPSRCPPPPLRSATSGAPSPTRITADSPVGEFPTSPTPQNRHPTSPWCSTLPSLPAPGLRLAGIGRRRRPAPWE
jgi:hypothetical protein